MVESTTYFDIYWETTIWVSEADVNNGGFFVPKVQRQRRGVFPIA